MHILIAADHRGFTLKQELIAACASEGITLTECGSPALDPHDDYPDVANMLVEAMQKQSEPVRGIALCGSGIGICIAANRHKNIQAAVGHTPELLRRGCHDDHVNVLVLAADMTTLADALALVRVFLSTPPGTDERYVRRLKKMNV
jgi:ribose 5-phosphate isomerase B